jgi:NAD(P)H-nitrite reductase large subunit
MGQPHYVIIGNGSAGNQAAAFLRNGDQDARISIISAEPTQYTCRHGLASFLIEDRELESLSVNSPDWYDERNIRLRLNQPVVKVNPHERWLLLAHREKLNYDKLLICSGASHRIPEYLSHFESLLTRFSSGKDALLLKARLDNTRHITLLGGDCIGLQLLTALLPKGKKVTLVMDEYKFWPLEFDDQTKDRLATSLEKKDVEVIRDDFVIDIKKQETGLLVKTRGGANIETGEAIVCSGMTPDLSYLGGSGIDLQQGVLVNERLETNIDNVWVAGECAQIYYPEISDYRLSTGYLNAQTQGRLAAENMLGGSEHAVLPKLGNVVIAGEKFSTYGWKGFSLDETN